jgi:PAS domain S-box-containing protein
VPQIFHLTHAGRSLRPAAIAGGRRYRDEDLEAITDEAPAVVIVDAAVPKPTTLGRAALRRWPTAKILFLVEAGGVERLRASLPFIPDLAGAVVLANEAPAAEIDQVMQALAAAAARDREISGLYRRLNTQVERIAAARDAVSERQEQLALAERYLAAVLDHAPQALVSVDLEGLVVSFNHAAADLFSLSRGDSGGSSLTDHFAPLCREDIAAALAVAGEGRTVRLDATIERGADILSVEFSVAPVVGPNGEVGGLSIALLDVTERKRIATALADANRRLNAVLNNATVAIFVMDQHQHCVYLNDAAEHLTGYALAETQGRPLHDVIHHTRPNGAPYPLDECPIDRAFPENHQTRGEDVFVHKDGRYLPVAYTASPIQDDDARTVGTIIEVRDIAEEKRNEQARDLLMREVDHRARNVLAVAQSMVQLTQGSDLPQFKASLLGRISALSRAQSSLSKTSWQGAELRTVVVDELEGFGRPSAYAVDGPETMLRPEQVQPFSMVIHELATNAAKYGALSTQGGRVAVSWALEPDGGLALTWAESGGPAVDAPSRQGFGSRLIVNLAKQLRGTITFDWRPGGLTVALCIDGDGLDRAHETNPGLLEP